VINQMTRITEGKAICSIIVGCGAIAFSLVVNQFYTGRILGGPTSAQGRPIPRWRGRLIFIVGGSLFILVGLKFFLFDR
jgi:hypothetical protein